MEDNITTIEELNATIAALNEQNQALRTELADTKAELDKTKKELDTRTAWWHSVTSEKDRLRSSIEAIGTLIQAIQ